MKKELSATMLEVVEYMKKHDDVILRHPGGFWGEGALKFPTWGASSVHALVLRGVADYSEWAEGRNGRFPIAAKLKRAAPTESSTQVKP